LKKREESWFCYFKDFESEEAEATAAAKKQWPQHWCIKIA
jgi:hypothetical protein